MHYHAYTLKTKSFKANKIHVQSCLYTTIYSFFAENQLKTFVVFFLIVYLLLIKATKELYIMKTAMREWEKYTCIKFREKTSSDVNYVRIQNGHGWGFFSWWKKEIDLWHDRDCNSWRIIKVKTLFTFRCNSQLGMVGGEQILNLDINGCRWVKQTFLPVIWTTIPLLNHITIYENWTFFRNRIEKLF